MRKPNHVIRLGIVELVGRRMTYDSLFRAEGNGEAP